jgi:hypothetical protein
MAPIVVNEAIRIAILDGWHQHLATLTAVQEAAARARALCVPRDLGTTSVVGVITQ